MTGFHEELLPDPLPSSPMGLAVSWFERAATEAEQPNPEAMVLATADEEGIPSARVVLCKRLVADPGFLVFFTNYSSRKARELECRPRAAAVFHWDTLRRQMRIEGCVARSPDDESDAYFASRAWQSRIGAWASRQSRPIESRDSLLDAVAESAASFGASFAGGHFVDTGDAPAIDRPPFWGGYRLWIGSLELWTEGEGRVHDRAVWSRELARTGEGWSTGEWQGTRLQP
jgi:pyridoxamine 5'-phosphate oxidase